jgi:hypothetical protein
MAKRKSAIDPRHEITRGGGMERPDLACFYDIENFETDLPRGHYFHARSAGNIVGVEAVSKDNAKRLFFFCEVREPKKGEEYFDLEQNAARQALRNMLSEGFLPKVYVEGVAI